MLDIQSSFDGTRLTIALTGVLDTQRAPELNQTIQEHIGEAEEVNFDFAGLEYLTSAGLRVLLVAQQQMDDRNGRMTFRNVSEEIMELFEMTGFTDVLTIL